MVGNPDHMNVRLGKAGRSRWLGRRPHVRGVAMNPVDHPMGGGEGRLRGPHPCSPTGKLAKGGKTRRRRKPSNKAIIRRRPASGMGSSRFSGAWRVSHDLWTEQQESKDRSKRAMISRKPVPSTSSLATDYY